MPKNSEADILTTLGALADGHDTVVFIEDVPKWCGGNQFARKNIFGASMATLYGNFKLCQGICMGLGLTTHKRLPIVWQKIVGARENGMTSSNPRWKNHLKEVSQTFCDFRVTLATADAVLIAVSGVLKTAK